MEKTILVEELAKKYEITGANIINVIQYACFQTISRKHADIKHSYLMEGIRKEYQKEGKSLNL